MKDFNVIIFSITDFQEQCMAHEFQCENNMCISVDYVCDEKDDCNDGSDETNCGGFSFCELKQKIIRYHFNLVLLLNRN